MIRLARASFACLVVAGLTAGCIGPKGDSLAEKRQAVRDMRADTLNELYQVHPQARGAIASADGYGAFSNVGVNLFVLSTGNGWGIVRDNETGEEIYMRMFTAGVGLGLGVKDFRGVFVFTDRDALIRFIEKGWEAGAQADAVAKAGEKGGALAGAVDIAPGIKLYQITENGLALQATIQGSKYWKDGNLN